MNMIRKYRSYLALSIILLLAVFMVCCLIFGITGVGVFHWFGLAQNRCAEDQGAFAFYRVGNGDASAVYTNQVIGLVDTGTEFFSRSLQSELLELTDSHLDFVVISHPHDDHAGGYFDLLEHFTIDRLFIRSYLPEQLGNWEYYQSIIDSSRAKNVEIIHPKDRDLVTIGDISIQFYSPSFFTEDENERCLLTRVTVKESSCLYTGDCGLLTEEYLLTEGYEVNAEILKVGHHGSGLTTSDRFLSAVSPNYAVICVGSNHYGHPAPEILDKLRNSHIPFYRTDSLDKIVFSAGGPELLVTMNDNAF